MGEGKTKCFLFKKGKKQYPALNITRNKHKISILYSVIQYSAVEYLECLLNENMSGEFMTKRALKKINGKKILTRQNSHLTYPLERMLCNSQIQPHFDFTSYAWHPNLSMSLNHFEKSNWLSVKNRVDQCIAVMAYNFKNNLSPVYMSDIYS